MQIARQCPILVSAHAIAQRGPSSIHSDDLEAATVGWWRTKKMVQ